MPSTRRPAWISKRAKSVARNRRIKRRRRLLLEPLEPRRLLAHLELSTVADGLVADRELDGTFETVLDSGTSISDRWFAIADIGQERGVFEFDLTGISAGATVTAAKIGLDFITLTGSSDPLGDWVWYDANGNGVQDAGEAGVAGAVVELFESSDAIVGNEDDVSRGIDITDSQGQYQLAGLVDGRSYYVEFRAPTGYFFTTQDAGSDDGVDSDANGLGVTAMFVHASGQDQRGWDAGLVDGPPEFGFAGRAGGPLDDNASAVATDAAGNVYVTGVFREKVDFDFGPGVYDLHSCNTDDVYVAKYTPQGALIWARGVEGSGTDASYGLAVTDAGDVIVTGTFQDTADVDPGAGTYSLSSTGSYDAFLWKLDAAGDLVWAKRWGGTDSDGAHAVATGADGSVYTAGLFRGTVDFDPGPGTFELTVAGSQDAYVSKLDPTGEFVNVLDRTGNLKWAQTFGGVGDDQSHGVAVATDGGAFLGGLFPDTVDFDPRSGVFELTNQAGEDLFLARLAPPFAPTDVQLNDDRVLEDQPAGTPVGALAGVDPDAGETFTFRLASGTGDTDNGSFRLEDGWLWTEEVFDYEVKSSYSIRVRATDGSGLWFEKPLTIRVLPIAQAASTGNRVWRDANEDGLQDAGESGVAGVVVELFSTGDGMLRGRAVTDTNGQYTLDGLLPDVTYHAVVRPPAGYSFTVADADTADFDPGAEVFPLTSSGFRNTFLVKLTSNRPPQGLALSNATALQNSPAGTLVGYFSTTDPNAEDTFTYTLVPGAGDTDNGAFDIIGRKLETSTTFGGKSSYNLRARTTDRDGQWFEATFVITVAAVVDVPPEVVSVVRADGNPTNSSTVRYTVTFSEPVTGVGTDDFLLVTNGVVGAAVTTVAGSGTTYTVTVDSGSGDGTLRLDVGDDDTILRAGTSPTDAAEVTFTVTFSESVTGVDIPDFALTATALPGAALTGVSGSGDTWTVTASTGLGDGTIRLDVADNDSILDAVTNPLGGTGAGNGDYAGGETYIIDRTGEIHGRKWDDRDGDGYWDPAEPGMAGVTMFLDLNNNSTLDAGEPTAITEADDPGTTGVDETGQYRFEDLGPATYFITEVTRTGWEQTYPFSRTGATGQLTFVEAVKDGVGGVDGLYFASGVSISADGKHLYVAGKRDDAIAVFSRNATTGALTYVQKCTHTSLVLTDVIAVTVSPDGGHVYTANDIRDMVGVFSRSTSTGQLTFVEEFTDNSNGIDGLDEAWYGTVSPDGTKLYVVGATDDTLVTFSRNAGTVQPLRYTVTLSSGEAAGPLDFANANDAPRVTTITRLDSTPTGASSVRFAVTFSEVVTGVDSGDFLFGPGAASGATITNISGSGTDYTVTVDTGSGDGTLRLDLTDDDSILDGGDRPLGGVGTGDGDFTGGESYVIDRTPPDVAFIGRSGANPTDKSEVGFTVTFTESVTGVDVGDFNLVATGSIAGEAIVSVSGSGSTYTVTASAGSGDGTLRLDLVDDDSIIDQMSSVSGLTGAFSVTVSPDGKNVYVASTSGTSSSSTDGAIVAFSRNPATGQVTKLNAIYETSTDYGLGGAQSVTVSPDGKHIYVAGTFDDAVAVLSRDETTGALTHVQTMRAGTDLDYVQSLAVSPDGSYVYAVGTDYVTTLARNETTGQLSHVQTLRDGVDGIDGLDNADSIVMSPDGKHVYTVSYFDDALVAFDRNATTGELSLIEIEWNGQNGVDGLYLAYSVTISSDGKHVYTVSRSGGLAVFARDPATGEVTFIDVIQEGVDVTNVLAGAHDVKVANDGAHVYVASYLDNTLSTFSRDPSTGLLSFVQVHTDGVAGIDGLYGVRGVAVSPDGSHVYTASYDDDLVVFERDGRVRRQHRIDVATAQVVENIDFGNHDLPPVVESLVRADTDPTNQTEVDYTLTFNEPVTGVDPTDFALATSGVSSASVTGVSGGSVVYTVTVNTGNGDGTLRLDLTDDDSIVDSVGNELGGAGSGNGNFTGEIYTIDKTGPRVSSIVRVDPNPTSAASVRFTVNFNEGVTGVDVGDFTLSTTGVLTGASITDLSGSGSTRTVTINTGDGNGTLRLDLSDNDTIIDGLGNPLGGAGTGNGDYTSGQDYTVLKTGEVHGTKWRDLDGDGVRDAGEPGLVDVRIFADLNNNGVLDGNEPNTLTLDDDPATTTVDETGTYQLTAVPAGTRAIVELVPAGYEQSFPATTVSGTGQLTFVEAVKDAQDDVAGLYGAQALAASPDGRHIYAGSYLDDSLAVFGRDPATGKLAFVQAVEDNVAGVDGLHEVLDVVVSPDGAHVYAVGGADDAVAVFSRDATSGQLSFVQAVYDDQNGVDGLDLPKSVAISPDGDHLYVASTYDNALAVFSRNAATGELTFVRVLKDGQGGVDALAGANSVAVSPDGNYVFATASTDRSVMQFARNATTGELTLSTTRTDGVGDADGLNASRAVTVSPDSEHVYVAASFPDHSVATYAEAQPAAGLPFVQVLKDGAGGVDGLAGARSVSVSPDGRNVYVAGSDDDALAVFGRDAATGQLSYSQTLWDDQGGVDGLDYSPSVIVSPDGLHVYAASYYDHAVSVFQRSVDSQQSIPHNVPVTAGQVTADVHFGNRPVWPTVVSVVRADANPTAAATVDFTVTFSENVSAVDAGDFSVLAVGVTGAVVTGVTGSDNTYTVTVNTGSGEGTIRLAVNDDDSINDTDANPLGGNGADNGEYLSGESYAVDKVPPAVVSIVRLDPNPTSATRVSYEVTFSEDVTGVDVGDFTVYADGLTGTNVDRMSGSGAVYTVYVNTGTGEGTVRLDVDDNDSIVNDFGNPLGGLGANNGIFNSGESYTIATTGSLEGIKWNDGNGNGVRDAGEPGLANWKIYLDANRNGQLDAGETSTLTATDDAGTPGVDETGWYTFTGLVPGTHAMAEEVQTGWQQTWPGPAGVDLERIVADDSRQSYTPAISGDGRFVAFASTRSDLVANDTNNRRDIFVYDRQTDTIERVSVHSNGTQSTADSWEPTISEDGRYVAFRSGASNLVDVDTNGDYDIFVHDRDTDETVLASVDSDAVQGDSYSYKPNLSDDGRYVAFWSNANNLVPNDTNQVRDIFVRDLVNGTTERVSVDSDENQAMGGHSYGPVLSADGRYVVFQSAAANLVAGDTNQKADVFVRDRVAGTTERVSVASDASEGNGASSKRWINDDGRYVVFESTASNLVPGDTNGRADIFLHDRDAGQTRRVSVGSDGTQGDNNSYLPQISGDGRYVAFQSWATNFDSRDSNATRDVFVHDVLTGSTRRLSVATDGSDSNGLSETAAISSDGRFVAFPSEATNLLSQDPLQKGGLFVADVQVPTTPGSWNANVSLGVTTEDIDFGNQGISAAPTSVDLLAASDTGASNTDNLTNLDNSTAGTRLQFEVSGTVSGATVGVYADGTLIGSAVASGVTTTVTTNGSNDLVDGSHSITARQTIEGKMLSPASSALSFIVDTAAATITDVIIGSSFWTNAGFIDAVDGGGTGAGNGLGLSLPGSGQLRNLPWINIDKIYIQFSEDVAAAFSAANLALVGTNVADYEPFANLQYGVDGANIGTITLTAPIANDALILAVFDSLTDPAGNALDGEWVDGVRSASGNGNAGGQFNFRMDVLPGDVDDSGGVNLGGDVLAVFAVNDTVVQTLADAVFDVDGSGGVNFGGDLLAVFQRNDTILPAAPSAPSPPAGGSALFGDDYASAVDSLAASDIDFTGALSERFMRSIKEACLLRMIFFGKSTRRNR